MEVKNMRVALPNHPHFVPVHGLSHVAWCWYKIRFLLETVGYKVSCLDLKSAGRDQSDPNTVLTLDDYSKPLFDFLSNLPDDEKVILVGHSAGGLSLTQSIHTFANKIRAVVYTAADMLKYGYTTAEDRKHGTPDESEDMVELEYGMGPDKPPTSVLIKEEFRREILYHLSSKEDSYLASMLLRPRPLRAIEDVQFVPGPGSDGVARVFIKTLYVHLMKLWQQEAMIRKWQPC